MPKLTLGIFLFLLTASLAAQPQGGEGERRQPPSVDQLFQQMDKNKDNRLSQDEIKGPLKDDFAKIDTNKDNYLTKEEIQKAPKPERPRR